MASPDEPHGHPPRIVPVTGRIDHLSSAELLVAVRAAIQDEVPGIVIDLRLVSGIDSGGLATLVQARREATMREIVFALVGPCPFLDEAYRKSGLPPLFELHPTVESALA